MGKIGLLLFGGWLVLAGAQAKVGYIDSERIFQGYPGAAEARAKFQDELAGHEARLREMQQELEKFRTELDAQRLMLSDEARAAKEAELSAMQRRYEAFVQEIWGPGGKLEAKNRELTLPLVQKINEAVRKVAQANGYTLVLDVAEGGILYAQPEFDLTALVLEELAKEYAPIALPLMPKKFAVFPLLEHGPEARAARLGEGCRSMIETILDELSRKARWITRLDRVRVDDLLSARGGVVAPDPVIAKAIGRELGADYLITGAVERRGAAITVELTLTDLSLDRAYPPEKGEAEREELLQETIAGLVQRFLEKIER